MDLPTEVPGAPDPSRIWQATLPTTCRRWLVALAATLLIGAHAAEAPDPFAWRAPADPPSPPAMLDDAEYAKRRDAALVGVDLEALAKAGKPAGGLALLAVTPGSMAERKGLATGDLLLRIDRQPLRVYADLVHLRDLERAQSLDVWTARAGRRTIALETGLMGVTSGPSWNPDSGHLAVGPRSPAWDRDLVVAGRTYRSDPALALTALAHARAAGYAGPYLRTLQACACQWLGRNDEALALGFAAREALPSAERAMLIDAIFAAALLEGRLPTAQVIGESDGWQIGSYAPFVADHAQRLARHASFADPLAVAAATPSRDLIGMTRCTYVPTGSDESKAMRVVAYGDDALVITPPVGQWSAFEFTPPAVGWLDCSLDVELRYPVADQGLFVCGIGPPGDTLKHEDRWPMCEMVFTDTITAADVKPGFRAEVGLRGLDYRAVTPFPGLAVRDRFHLRLVVRDGQVGAVTNGARQGVLPLLGDPTQRRSIYLFASGCRMALKKIAITGHDDQAPPGWTPPLKKAKAPEPEGPPTPPAPKAANDF